MAPTQIGSIVMTDEDILARLKVIDERLRTISAEDAAAVLAGGLAGIREEDRLSLIAETERILDELDGNRVDPARDRKESEHSKGESFTAFRSAFEEVDTKRREQELVKGVGNNRGSV